jgi:hypothetical protein
LAKPYPFFNLPRLIAEPDKRVLIDEGARKAVVAQRLFPDSVATAMLFGAKAPSKSDFAPLAGRDCIIWPDHDAAGLGIAREVAALVHRAGAASVRVVDVPDWFPPKWDLCDPLPMTVTVDDLRALLKAAPVAPISNWSEGTAADGSEGSPELSPDLLAELVERAKIDIGAAFEGGVLRQIVELRIRDYAAFMRLRADLKAKAKVPLGELDKALDAVARENFDAGGDEDPNQATALVRLATEASAELFHNAAGDGYVTVQIADHRETWPVRSKAARRRLVKRYFDATRAAPNSEAGIAPPSWPH